MIPDRNGFFLASSNRVYTDSGDSLISNHNVEIETFRNDFVLNVLFI